MSLGAHCIGFGLHTRLGRGLEAHAAALKNADTDLLGLPTPLLYPLESGVARAPYHLAAGEPLGDPNRCYRLLEGVVADAIASSGLNAAQLRRTALFVGSSSSDIGLIEEAYRHDLGADPAALPLRVRSGMANLEQRLRERFALGPDGYSFNTACTAAANALLCAGAAIEAGRVEHALVVGAELYNSTTALGFYALELLSRAGMRPFDPRRDGLVLGEACAALVLAQTPARGALRLLGGAALSDLHSISSSTPDGSTIEAVILAALKSARAAPREIGAVKAHATASLLNDEAEAAGLLAAFGGAPPLLCALKPYVGHTFGACALVELCMIAACLENGFWPGAPGIAAAKSELGLALPQEATPIARGKFLLNTFGFGGSNTCMVVAND